MNIEDADFNEDAFDIASRCWLRLQVRYFSKRSAPNREEQLRNDKAAAALTNKLKRRREILKNNPTKFTVADTEKLVHAHAHAHTHTHKHAHTQHATRIKEKSFASKEIHVCLLVYF